MSDAARNFDDYFCCDLPTTPWPADRVVLVTGASGYIGGRLVPELIARGYRVRVMVRGGAEAYRERWPGAEVVVADALQRETLATALGGIYVAYFLIHSLLLGTEGFVSADLRAAQNFADAAAEAGVERIIYLGGLGDRVVTRSRHLQSRMEVGNTLARGRVPVTTLRAAIIIGSGSASYEIVRHLVSRVPVLFIPRWAKNLCQPIAVRDVIKYLVGVLEVPVTAGMSYDIGGRDRLTYEDMLRTFAEILGRKILFLPGFTDSIRVYSYFAGLITPVPAPITAALMEGLQDEVIVKEDSLRPLIAFEPLGYREAIARALTREEQDRVHSRWSDSYPPAHELAMKLTELDGGPAYRASFSIISEKPAAAIFKSVCAVGGKTGWFHSNWMWRLRGIMDQMVSGVGSARGRRSQSTLSVHDVVDFFRVEDLKKDRRLVLRAEMKLPGKAWLEFDLDPMPRAGENPGAERTRLSITASFDTTTLFGRAYWYFFLPFHYFIFTRLLEQIERRA